jgi:hypothetical protein
MFPLVPEVPPISNEFTDLGFANISPNVRATWMAVRMDHARAVQYYNGLVFEKKIDIEGGDPANSPLMYPVQLNLVKMLINAMTDSFIGEMEDTDDAVMFSPAPDVPSTDKVKKTMAFCSDIVRQSHGQQWLWECGFDRNLYGGCAVRVLPAFNLSSRVRWQRIPIDAFYPIFDPEDPNKVIECYISNYLFPEQARQKYGWTGETTAGYVKRTEHWTRSEYHTYIDDKEVSNYSGVNPWGVVPFVYIPSKRSTTIFGESLAKDLYAPQDEINMRIADAGEALNYNMHPTRWGMNLPNSFKAKNFPVAADAMWDLGRSTNKDMKPEVGILEVKQSVPPELFNYVKFLYDWSRTAAGTPPIAYGEDNGGGQRSGATLEIRLWPLLKTMRTSRSYFADGIRQLMDITGTVLKQKKFDDIPAYMPEMMSNGEVSPRFHRIMPRDQAAAVDEVVKLMSVKSGPQISMETAQEVLGRSTAEVTRILAYMDYLEDENLFPYDPKSQGEVPMGNEPTDGDTKAE